MIFKLSKHKSILVFRAARILGSNPSDKILYTTIKLIGLSPNYFEQREKTYCFFYKQVRSNINSFVIKNKLKQLLNCKPKSNINDSNNYAVN